MFASWWTVVVFRVLLCGKWLPFALCSACGGKEMIEVLWRSSSPFFLFSFFFFNYYYDYFLSFTWTAAFLAPLVISFSDFLVPFSSST
jgi:hypothetical protein